MDRDSQCRLAAGCGAWPRADLHREVVSLPKDLRSQIAPVEFAKQCLREVCRIQIAVKESLVHVFDYNREAIFPFRVSNVMKRLWFQLILGVCVAASMLGLLFATTMPASVRAQAANTNTPVMPGGTSPFITQTYTEAVNIRTGPSTVYYPVIGQLPIGATAPALAASPSREWIEISYPGGPGGVGWVYAANVTLTGTLQVVEPPPTPTPLATSTIDPTLAAAFSIQPTETRLPTFTPPPPLVVPTFSDLPVSAVGFPWGMTIIAIAVAGAVVLSVSFFVRR